MTSSDNYQLPDENSNWKTWHVPFEQDQFTLRQVLDSMQAYQKKAVDIPLIVCLVENPKFNLPWINVFEGAVNLFDHDCIHALLGRGMMPKDEAFVIGFTMGSSNRTGTLEQAVFGFIAKHLYPGPYKLTDEEVQVFKDAAHLGYVSDCRPLSDVDYSAFIEMTVHEARQALGIETELLRAYYQIEARRYPESIESQRQFTNTQVS